MRLKGSKGIYPNSHRYWNLGWILSPCLYRTHLINFLNWLVPVWPAPSTTSSGSVPSTVQELTLPGARVLHGRAFPLLVLGSWANKPHALRFWLLPPLLDLAKHRLCMRSASATKRGQRSNTEVVPNGSYFSLKRLNPTIFLSLILPKAQSLWIFSLKTSHVAKQTHGWLVS